MVDLLESPTRTIVPRLLVSFQSLVLGHKPDFPIRIQAPTATRRFSVSALSPPSLRF